eukprot:s295_g22.t1
MQLTAFPLCSSLLQRPGTSEAAGIAINEHGSSSEVGLPVVPVGQNAAGTSSWAEVAMAGGRQSRAGEPLQKQNSSGGNWQSPPQQLCGVSF